MTDMTAYFAQLVGCRITAFRLEQDECGGAPWPIFTMTTPDGTTLDMCLSCDPEGNDGGLPHLVRRMIAGSELHRAWFLGYMGFFEQDGIKFGPANPYGIIE